MKLRYEQLFNIGFTAAYYVDNKPHEDFIVTPTHNCKKQMSRFRILSKKTADGIALLYECSPFTNDATPFKPIAALEKFVFKVSVTNPDTWYHADINNWEKDKVYFLKNPAVITTGDINILAGALNTPVLFRPMEFKHEVLLDNVPGLLEIRDAGGALIRSIIVRARTAAEPVGKKETYLVDLKNFKEDLYLLRHISSGPTVDEQAYCSIDYEPGTLAIVEISYKTGIAYTGVPPFLKYIINISSRLTQWFIDVNIRKKPVPVVLASDVDVEHIPLGAEPLQAFTQAALPDNVNGIARFKSSGTISYSQQPIRLRLMNTVTNTAILDPLPIPSSISLQKNGLILFTQIIVNV